MKKYCISISFQGIICQKKLSFLPMVEIHIIIEIGLKKTDLNLIEVQESGLYKNYLSKEQKDLQVTVENMD